MPASAAARRRRAVTLLEISASTCAYAASQLGNGLGAEEARLAAAEAAVELRAVARSLRRLTRPSAAERRRAERGEVARKLRAEGLPVRVIAARLGVTHPTIIRDLGRRDSTPGETG